MQSKGWICIRFLGAFGKHGTLAESIEYELHRPDAQVCATIIDLDLDTQYSDTDIQVNVGLLVAKPAIKRFWDRDVWSSPKRSNRGYLAFGKQGNPNHNEAWVLPHYTAVVCKRHPSQMSKATQDALMSCGLKILYLHKGTLKEVTVK